MHDLRPDLFSPEDTNVEIRAGVESAAVGAA
jgi:hypothetical protein